ncbi:MAG TPA: quinolinate synthase NadA [Methanomassiliicoccales archaeon]|nr:quinolinate synthase NadA [Methanomassiliicoccales archaeon]
MRIEERILALRNEKNAIILAHNYQRPEVQDIADFVGDSLGLSVQASKTNADVIVFCGVDFMAESAKVLSPGKKVLLPEENAQCPMAAMVDVPGLLAMKREHPNAAVVSYVNTSAAVKAESDICCTSANAVKVVKSLSAEEIIFVPDENLGKWVKRSVPDKRFVFWPGFCPTHDSISPEQVKAAKTQHPEAKVVAHPECRPGVLDMADAVKSTEGMIKFVKEDPAKEFIIVTERELLHRLQKETSGKVFHALEGAVCPNMKRIRLESVEAALDKGKHEILLPSEVISRARAPLEKMMAVGRGD